MWEKVPPLLIKTWETLVILSSVDDAKTLWCLVTHRTGYSWHQSLTRFLDIVHGAVTLLLLLTGFGVWDSYYIGLNVGFCVFLAWTVVSVARAIFFHPHWFSPFWWSKRLSELIENFGDIEEEIRLVLLDEYDYQSMDEE